MGKVESEYYSCNYLEDEANEKGRNATTVFRGLIGDEAKWLMTL